MQARTSDPRRPPTTTPSASPLLQRAGKCGSTCSCRSCAASAHHAGVAPPEVEEVVAGTGHPLDAAAQPLLQATLGHDFSHVRVHHDARAAESARSVDALAYTVGHHVVFGAGRYAPSTPAGQALLLHELTHVVQQGRRGEIPRGPIDVGPADTPHERQADQAGRNGRATVAEPGAGLRPVLQRQSGTPPTATGGATTAPTANPAALDATAQAIIATGNNASVPVGQRAVAVVRAIVNAYYAADAALISDVVSSAVGACGPGNPAISHGLRTTSVGTGATTTGCITVADDFADFSSSPSSRLAHRVLQVGHELDHIRQYRAGQGGATNRHLREFLAFTREARAPAVPHTGQVSHSTRVSVIDAALGEYFCLTPAQQTQYQSDYTWLHNERPNHTGRGVNPDPPEPTTCTPSS